MRILVADDDNSTLKMLVAALKRWGYDPVAASNGEDAYAILIEEAPPRIALLDWMMPGFDGPSLCKMLQQRSEGPLIYTLIVTAKEEHSDVVEGLRSGAHDYLKKPVNLAELRSRIEVGERIIHYDTALAQKSAELARYAAEMENLAEERAHQLVHADRMATLGTMAAGMAHEINNPASFISGNVQTFQRFWEKLAPIFEKEVSAGHDDSDVLRFVLNEMPKLLDGMRNGVSRIRTIVDGLRTYARQDEKNQVECHIHECIRQSLELCHNVLKRYVTVEQDLGQDVPTMVGNPSQLEQVLINIFTNAAHAMEKQGQGILRISSAGSNGKIRLVIEDTGPGIPPDKIEGIWQPFFTTKEVGKGTGLGLSISQSIIEAHGGTIRAENAQSGGARFLIELPPNP